jgi:hypothetical protein
MAMLKPALTGAIGAVLLNTIMGKLPIPAQFTTGRVRYVTQAVGAIALGVLASKVGVKGTTAAKMAEGALTVTLNDALKDIASQAGFNLAGLGYYLPGLGVQAVPSANAAPAMTMNGMRGLGAYVNGPGSMQNVVPMRGMAGLRGMRGFNL